MGERADVVILGVDASLRCTGLAVVQLRGSSLSAVHHEVVRNSSRLSHGECLLRLYRRLREVIGEHHPSAVVLESAFYRRNVRTAITLGEARGVVLAAAAESGVGVFEYSPREIKLAMVGSGAAHKSQVSYMVQRVLSLPSPPPEDAADAFAAAICHAHRLSAP